VITYDVEADGVVKSHGYLDPEWARKAAEHVRAYDKAANIEVVKVTVTREVI
jgi:hypothetical protein